MSLMGLTAYARAREKLQHNCFEASMKQGRRVLSVMLFLRYVKAFLTVMFAARLGMFLL